MDLAAIGGAETDGGVVHGRELAAFAEAVAYDDETAIAAARDAVTATLGPDAMVDAAAVAATFNAIDRVADSTGIPIDEERLDPSADFRAALGIDAFPSRAGTN